MTTTLKHGRYGMELSDTSQHCLRCARHLWMCRRRCEVRVNMGSPYLCVVADTTGLEGLLRHNGLVIDLSHMRRVDVDPVASVATIQGGATAVDVTSAATPHGLVAATGNCGTVGMVGLTTGGGYGPLTPSYGLTLDNLLSAEVVLADGRLVIATNTKILICSGQYAAEAATSA